MYLYRRTKRDEEALGEANTESGFKSEDQTRDDGKAEAGEGTEKDEIAQAHTSRPCQTTLGIDKESILLEAMRKQTAELRVFIALYSYDPFDGPNEWPELELPLVAGQYIYVYGDVDENGWYVGELRDGTRGFVPSNLVEEVSDDHPTTPESPEASDCLQDTDDAVSCLLMASYEIIS